ncbi:methyl-accepting chemotaxis protein [Anaeromicrobium sediminis]|uniref:Methyl-accepting chemotaxis protein n=1 Tax=Anaeromicrobium sediminis TaxID=1478221 RepID=A0A267MG93_9FIRM|nr:methyl-accepting chemotaxis protein [Anaeromicrobium sediminis]PAB58601.1 hypothetical protein CCE28_14045 [Anaeromicrobium sediminis]
MKIRNKLFLAFAIMILLTAILGAMGLNELNKVNKNMESMYYDQVNGVNFIKEAQYYIGLVQRTEKNILISSSVEEKKEHFMHLEEMYSQGIIENLNQFKKISDHGTEDGIDVLIDKVNMLKNIQINAINKNIEGNEEEALALGKESMKISNDIEKLVDKIVQHKLEEGKHHYDKSMESYHKAFKLVVISIIVAIIIGILLAKTISLSIVKPLHNAVEFAKGVSEGDLTNKIQSKSKDEIGILIGALNNTGEKLKNIVSQIKFISSSVEQGSEQLTCALDESNKGTNEIGHKISDISHSTQEVLISVENIDTNINEVAHSATEILDFTNLAMEDSIILKNSAEKGRESVDIVAVTISDVEKTTKEVKDAIEELNDLSKKIGEITELIKNIASQTNMLALNANIEAAKAGEHGRGFTIVAEEVRNLAEESAQAAKSIDKMISEVQNKTHRVVNNILVTEDKASKATLVAKDTAGNIKIIMERIENLVEKIEEISKESSKQANATGIMTKTTRKVVDIAQEVALSTENMNGNMQEQVAITEEIGVTSEQLYEMTEALNRMIEFFKV